MQCLAGPLKGLCHADPAYQIAEPVADQDSGDFVQAAHVPDRTDRLPEHHLFSTEKDMICV